MSTIAILCARKGDPHWNPIPGSAEGACAACSSAVLISPASLGIRDQHQGAVTLICMECWEKLPAKPPIFTTAAHERERRRIKRMRAELN